jgi:indolepyruvate ferredoxin oxidoreductase
MPPGEPGDALRRNSVQPCYSRTMSTFSLDDRYTRETGAVYLTGIQALVRLPMDQVRRDRGAGLNTGAFISGYEGSPLGGYDMALSRVRGLLAEHRIHFTPGVNEDLAATSVFGSQIAEVAGTRNVDGIIGIWYGKGPGVDRSGDILRHANLAGAGRNSAALVLAGDDPAAKSSTIPHQSDLSLYNVGIPFLYPGNTQETLDYGLLAIALSRFSGAWTGLKMITNVCDGGGTVNVDAGRLNIELPEGYQKRTDPRLVPPFTLAMEMEVNRHRLAAAESFARMNSVNRVFGVKLGAKAGAKLGIATAGKTYYDLMQALADLGIGADQLEAAGIRIAKFGMVFPVERHFAADFADGLSTILVIEEKRSFLEMQLRQTLYNLPSRPVIVGKEDEHGHPLVPPAGELDPDMIATLLSDSRFGLRVTPRKLAAARKPALPGVLPRRAPNFCSGCPHNRSTLILEGQLAGGGIGCHGMAIGLVEAHRGYSFITQMGGEGAPWIGMAPFVDRQHIFQNIGDGTFAHSGQLAVNAAIAAGVNVTYKILYNRAVAMTGGQQASGALPVPELTRKLEAEGVRKIVVLAEDAHVYDGVRVAENCEVRDRNALETVLAELEKVPGVTVIIYDQQCAAEKRRMRSRGKQEEPVRRLVIHEGVCEGCGDCVKQSNCMSLHPVETEFGQKMRIHQSSCNKDYSCALGDCPSFVTVNLKPGTGLRRRKAAGLPDIDVPPPTRIAAAGSGYRILMPGIGGTGVVTINALLATAAILEGLHVQTLDQTGLAQKGGAVVSHLLLSENPVEGSNKINAGNADLILGFDLLGAAAPENMKTAQEERTVAVVNTAEVPTGESIRARAQLGGERLVDLIDAATTPGHNLFLDANRLAEGLFGTHMAVNLFMLGAAWQAGLVPVSAASIEEAIRLNGVEAERNLRVFLWGRKYYQDASFVENLLTPRDAAKKAPADRASMLEVYQDRAYAGQYRAFLASVEQRDPDLAPIVARYLYKLMANKDEYEVARMLVDPEFERGLREQWEAVESIEYNLHPPLLRAWGMTKKLRLGAWFGAALSVLASLRVLRGTPLDLFGYTALRREERALVGWYRELIETVMSRMTPENKSLALEIAALPDQIRGYEDIRRQSIAKVKALAAEKMGTMASSLVSEP